MKKAKNIKPKLTGIYMNKFQCIHYPTYINVEGLTLLYGPNSAGKSSIIDALKLLKNISEDFEETGGYSDIDGFADNQKDGYGAAVGVEFIAGDIVELARLKKEIQQWRDTLDDKIFSEIFDFHAAICGNKVQIEFGDLGGSFKVAINGAPLIEFSGSDDEKSELFSTDGGVVGEVIIHKDNEWFKSLPISTPGGLAEKIAKTIKSTKKADVLFHRRVVVKDGVESLVVRGVDFSLNPRRSGGRVAVHDSAHSALFFKFDENKIDRDLLKDEEIDFLIDYYSKKSPNFADYQDKRRRLYFDLEYFVINLDLIIDGFFHQMKQVLGYSHVLGDRKLLNSNNPIGISAGGRLSKCINLDSEYQHLQNYSEYLAHIEAEYQYIYPEPVIKGDFINHCLKSHLISMKGYEVLSESSKITYVGLPEDGEIFFLTIRNPRMHILGFQDVGSGLSYMMPVLTSLWNHEFSIIEQPELHLHPKAQCEMGDVFISASNKGSIAVVESHSEHLLLRILRRIRETTKGAPISKELKLKAEEISIYYFDPVAEGHTIVRNIRVDRHGELLDLWPGGFFSERDSELFT